MRILQLLLKILDLHLQCKTQEEIAKIVGFKSQSTVADKINKIYEIIDEISKNSKTAKMPKWIILHLNFTTSGTS